MWKVFVRLLAVWCGTLLWHTTYVNTLDNGLALTPPMGWMSWQRFRCITDCVAYPDECIRQVLQHSFIFTEFVLFFFSFVKFAVDAVF